jgi:hypothetical protein
MKNNTLSIRVFIDTNALPIHPSKIGRGYKRLAQLVEYGIVQVFLSEIVVNEWRSQRVTEFEELYTTVHNSLQRLLRHPWSNHLPELETIQQANEILKDLKDKIEGIGSDQADLLLDEIDTKIISVDPSHTNLVLNSYFSGEAPFKVKKSRKDIPDAFIFQAVIGLTQNNEETLYCVMGDKNLKKAIEGIPRVVTFEKITDFVKSDVVQSAIRRIAPELAGQEMFQQLEPKFPDLTEEIIEILQDSEPYLDDLIHYEVYHSSLPSDREDARIEGLYEPENILIDWKTLGDFGSGVVSVEFSFESSADIYFDVFRGEAFVVPDLVWVNIQDLETNVFFDAGATIMIKTHALMYINFNLEDQEGENSPRIDSIDIGEIIKVEVIEDEKGNIYI